MTWDETFINLFSKICEQYASSGFDYETGYNSNELQFLANIGYKPREFFDFVEDYVGEKVPSPSTALLIAAVRRDYFLHIQNGQASTIEIGRDDLPSFGEELEGITYLPRILVKARAKLRGELNPDIMYGCGGDRNFLAKNGNIHPADFLRRVWASDQSGNCGWPIAKLLAPEKD